MEGRVHGEEANQGPGVARDTTETVQEAATRQGQHS